MEEQAFDIHYIPLFPKIGIPFLCMFHVRCIHLANMDPDKLLWNCVSKKEKKLLLLEAGKSIFF